MTEKEKAAWIDGARTAIDCVRFTLALLERDLPEMADKAEEDEGPELEAIHLGEAEAHVLS